MEIDRTLANAKGIGSFMGIVATECVGLLYAVREAHDALESGDVEKAKLILGNQIAPGKTFAVETLDLRPSQPPSGTWAG